MLKHLPDTLKGVLNLLLMALHTIFWCSWMYVFYAIRQLAPSKAISAWANRVLLKLANGWVGSNSLLMDLSHETKWEIPDLSHLRLDDWYFITCNHQCWMDILILQKIFLRRIPFIRFFIKKELLWLPVLNGAWFAYDFPILRRYPKHVLEKKPHLRGKDIEVTKKACDKYQHYPVTILNFLEGTRFTPEKHVKQESPYQNLLNPKIGGLAFALQAMNSRINKIIDVTIAYPDGPKSFWDFLCGRVKKVSLHIEERTIPSELLSGDYVNDPEYRQKFKSWATALWQQKDQKLTQLLCDKPVSSTSQNIAEGLA